MISDPHSASFSSELVLTVFELRSKFSKTVLRSRGLRKLVRPRPRTESSISDQGSLRHVAEHEKDPKYFPCAECLQSFRVASRDTPERLEGPQIGPRNH